MCQIMSITTTLGGLKKINVVQFYHIGKILQAKGGEYFSVTLLTGNEFLPVTTTLPNIEEFDSFFLEEIDDLIDIATNGEQDQKIVLVLFSRQAPEMEMDSSPEEQPYFIDNTCVSVHGTVHNDLELVKKYNLPQIKVDTEVFKYLDITTPDIEGTFTAITVSPELDVTALDRGLGVWEQVLTSSDGKNIATITATTELKIPDPTMANTAVKLPIRPSEERTLVAAFSSGMDIAFSVGSAISTGNYKKVILKYFDWGSNASKIEQERLKDFMKYYHDNFNQIPVEIEIISAKRYFDSYFDINSGVAKIADASAVGDAKETEAPIAYVPYRNTQFAILLASITEQEKLTNVDFIFGLNLSEGMVFMDNAEPWLESIQNVIRYGGSDFKITGGYSVIAPYFERTKTNMLLEFRKAHGIKMFEELLDLSYSCYYPTSTGEACGKCGSCLLRSKALLRTDNVYN